MALSKNLEKNTSFETREAIKESAEVEKAPKKTQGKHFNWSSIAKQENPESVLSNFFQDLYSIPGDQEEATQSERRHWVELWKNLRMDCAGGMLISPKETGKSLEVEKRDRLTGSDHMAVLFDSCGTRSGGRNVFVQVQADRWLVRDAKNLGLRMAQITPSTAVRKCAESVCAEDTRRCWSVRAAASSRTIARMAERGIVVVQLDVKKAFDHVDHLAALKAMGLQGASLFSMALIAALWNLSRMRARLGTVLSNKVRTSRGLPQGAPKSPVIFTMVMELVLRDLIKCWITRKLAWRLWRLEPLPFTVQPPATAGMLWHGVGSWIPIGWWFPKAPDPRQRSKNGHFWFVAAEGLPLNEISLVSGKVFLTEEVKQGTQSTNKRKTERRREAGIEEQIGFLPVGHTSRWRTKRERIDHLLHSIR